MAVSWGLATHGNASQNINCQETMGLLVGRSNLLGQARPLPGEQEMYSLVERIARAQGHHELPGWEDRLNGAVFGVVAALKDNPALLSDVEALQREVSLEMGFQDLCWAFQNGEDEDAAASKLIRYIKRRVSKIVRRMDRIEEEEDRYNDLVIYFLEEIRNNRILDRRSLDKSLQVLAIRTTSASNRSVMGMNRLQRVSLDEGNPAREDEEDFLSVKVSEKSSHSIALDDPESIFLQEEGIRGIESAVSSLPGNLPQVMRLAHFQDLPPEEISEILLISVNEVNTALERGGKLLRERLGLRNSTRNPSYQLIKLQLSWLATEHPKLFDELLATLPENKADFLRLVFKERLGVPNAARIVGAKAGPDLLKATLPRIRKFFARHSLGQMFPEVLESQAEAASQGMDEAIANAARLEPHRVRKILLRIYYPDEVEMKTARKISFYMVFGRLLGRVSEKDKLETRPLDVSTIATMLGSNKTQISRRWWRAVKKQIYELILEPESQHTKRDLRFLRTRKGDQPFNLSPEVAVHFALPSIQEKVIRYLPPFLKPFAQKFHIDGLNFQQMVAGFPHLDPITVERNLSKTKTRIEEILTPDGVLHPPYPYKLNDEIEEVKARFPDAFEEAVNLLPHALRRVAIARFIFYMRESEITRLLGQDNRMMANRYIQTAREEVLKRISPSGEVYPIGPYLPKELYSLAQSFKLAKAISLLEPDQRDVAKLRYVDHLTPEQIREKLGLTLKMYQGLIVRMNKSLREIQGYR